ncbi:MAG: homoserine kinase, partial [bacterium]|nr:homoserine kinase [bacterium]
QIEIKTADARAILPTQVPLTAAIKQWSNLASLIAALSKGDLELLGRSMEDFIVEPVRKSLIPSFDAVKEASLAAGAIGGGISGSGPSIFMLSESAATAESVRCAMHGVYSRTAIDFNIYVSEISPDGVKTG